MSLHISNKFKEYSISFINDFDFTYLHFHWNFSKNGIFINILYFLVSMVTKTYYRIKVSNDVYEHAKDNLFVSSLSKWVDEHYRNQFMKLEQLEIQKNVTLSKLKNIEQQISKFQEGNSPNVSTEIYKWVATDGLKRLETTSVDSLYKYINYHFKEKITLKMLRFYINQAKQNRNI